MQETDIINSEEYQYINLIKNILENGIEKDDRTGTGTLSIFGTQMRFNLNKFPLLTTKYVWFKGIAEELLWFISGSTNANDLSKKGVKIWNHNGYKNGIQGDLGCIYSFQWRHFGANYVDCNTDYSGQGIDQLAKCIDMIKNDPNSRRIVMTAWNPCDLDKMVLPPCHMFCQFYVNARNSNNLDGSDLKIVEKVLSCQVYQRSADVGLGMPFNIASYALLTMIVAQVCDCIPGEFIYTLGDAHIYKNHIEQLKEQILRTPYSFPTLLINKNIKNIDKFNYDDFKLVDYEHHPKLELPFSS